MADMDNPGTPPPTPRRDSRKPAYPVHVPKVAPFDLAVLQVLPGLVAGGVERGAIDVAAAVVAAGGRAVVASAGGPMQRELERAGAIHVTLPVDSKNPFVMRRNVGRLADVVAEHGIDLIHARSRAPAWSARAAARRTGCAFVTTFHGTYNFRNIFKKHYNAIMTRGQRVIAISEFIADHIRNTYSVREEALVVIPRGVDLAAFNPAAVPGARIVQLAEEWRLPDGLPVVMLPARLSRWKGQAVFLEALGRLGRDDYTAVMVGADQGHAGYRAELRNVVRKHGLETVIRFADHCRDMPAAFMLADVVVNASTDPEAFGRVVVEAQAMGRPVIATDHGGARETVVPDRTGWLVPPGDPDALATAIGTALDLSHTARERMANAAIRHVRENFSKELMCARTLLVYKEAAALRRRKARAPESGPA